MAKRADPEQQAAERKRAREKSDAERVRREGMRDTTAAGMKEKSATIALFVVERRAEGYPIDPVAAGEEVTMAFGGPPRAALERVLRNVLGDNAGTVAQALLTSADPEHSCDVGRLPPLVATVDRLLAHVELLRLGLEPAVAATVARRAALVLLSRGEPAPEESSPQEAAPPRTIPPSETLAKSLGARLPAKSGPFGASAAAASRPPAASTPELLMCIACGTDLSVPPVIVNATPGPPCGTCGRELPGVAVPASKPVVATPEPPPVEEAAHDYGFRPGPTLVLDFTHGHGVRLGPGPKFEGLIDWTTEPPTLKSSLRSRYQEDKRRATGYARTKCALTFQDVDGPATLSEGTVVELVTPNEWENDQLSKYAKRDVPHAVVRWRARGRFVAMRDIERADDGDWRRQMKRGT